MSALLMSVAVVLGVLAVRINRIDPGRYLGGSEPTRAQSKWDHRPIVRGVLAGLLLSLVGLDVNPTLLVPASAIVSMILSRLRRKAARRRRAEREKQEVPVVADTLALHIQVGASVAMAIRTVTSSCRGSVISALRAAVDHTEGVDAGLRQASRDAAHPEVRRLYDLLTHGHRVGGQLAEALTALARDQRASLVAQLTSEGGRRAIAAYGPILAFMVPVTLVFLMYPTLSGLTALSTTP